MATKKKTGPKSGSEQWAAEGPTWIYRRPLIVRGRWAVRRRNKQDDRVQQQILEAPVVTGRGRGIRAAKNEILERVAEEWQAYEAGQDLEPSNENLKDLTITQAFEAWLATLEVREVTLAGYQVDARRLTRLLGPDRKLASVSFKDVSDLFSKQLKSRSGRTKQKLRSFLLAFFRYFEAAGVVRANPVEKLRIPKAWTREARDGAKRGQAMTFGEARKFLQACREPFEVAFRPDVKGSKVAKYQPPEGLFWAVFIALRTGLRWSNIVGNGQKPGLQWKHIDLEKGELTLPGSLMKNHENYIAPIHHELLRELRRRCEELGGVPDPEETVVPRGEDPRKAFNGALVRAGLSRRVPGGAPVFVGELASLDPKPFRRHDLRHTFCTMLDDYAPITISRILKGDLMSGSGDRYRKHKSMEQLREALDRMPSLIIEDAKKRKEMTLDGAS